MIQMILMKNKVLASEYRKERNRKNNNKTIIKIFKMIFRIRIKNKLNKIIFD